ncbi:MAG: alcohol dehydrogenase catalytic domain-containing protein [Spirochaetota bacterium]
MLLPAHAPSTFSALRISGPEHLEFYTRRQRPLQASEVLVEVHACGICGSDLRLYRNGIKDFPYFGHEFSGTVVETGKDIEDFHAGDRITTGLFQGCGNCEPCRMGFENFCLTAQSTFFPGGFSQYCVIKCAGNFRSITKIPDELDDVVATLHEPLSCALRIFERAEAAKSSRIIIAGLGMMGLMSGLLFRKSFPNSEIFGLDTNPKRLKLAQELGIENCFLLDHQHSEALSSLENTGGVVVDATGVSSVFPLSLRLARLGGTVVLGGVPEGSLPFSPLPIFRKELTVKGAKGPYPFQDENGASRVVRFLLSADWPWDKITSIFSFEYAAEAFRQSAAGETLKTVLSVR